MVVWWVYMLSQWDSSWDIWGGWTPILGGGGALPYRGVVTSQSWHTKTPEVLVLSLHNRCFGLKTSPGYGWPGDQNGHNSV